MTSIASVKAVWDQFIFEHADVLAITENIFNYEYTEDSQFEVERLYKHNSDGLGEINFFEYIIDRAERVVEVGGVLNPEYQFSVNVRYTKQIDTIGNAEAEVREAIETICNLVRTELGSSWQTLNAKTGLEVIPEAVTRQEINQTNCVRQIVNFTAFIF